MAINKRKVLDAARKFAQKGAKERALKEYHVLLKLDPRDAKLHLEIGDAYRRWGQVEEAVSQYSRVADQYRTDGFDARAVAVYKQILNLDPKRYSAYVSLSELYQRMGLDAEAINALQAAADGYHKEGKKREALELLRKMATLDPTNTTSRLKVAELLRQEGMEDDAASEYEAVVAELTRQGELEEVTRLQERIIEMKPNRADVLVGLARNLIQLRQPERAEPYAKRAIAADSGNADNYELLCDIHKSLGNDTALAEVTRDLAKLYRERGDLDRARELAQRVPASTEFDTQHGGEGAEPGLDEGEDGEPLLDDDLLDEDFLASDTSEVTQVVVADEGAEAELGVGGDVYAEQADSIAGEPLAEQGISGASRPEQGAAEALPEGDPDQLMAEASVYLRYGKRDEAIASLQGLLLQEPDHRSALEKLGEAYAENGEPERAVEVWARAAAQAREEGDEAGLGILRDRIAALDPEAAQELIGVADAQGGEGDGEGEQLADAGFSGIDIDIGGDLDAGDDSDATAGVEIDLECDVDIDVGQEVGAVPREESESDDTPMVGLEAPAGRSPAEGLSGSACAQQVAEDLEEAEFYYQQSLYDEAEAIYRRVLAVAPNHPSALLRLGELAAARGENPSVDTAGAGVDAGATAVAAGGEEGTQSELSDGVELDGDGGLDLEIELPSDAGGDGGTDEYLAPEPPAAESPASSRGGDAAEGDGGFDLVAELRGALADDDKGASGTDSESAGLSTVEDGFASLFSEFKQGVSATLSEEDYETRYDLGIAYHEMELYEDAIGEFRMCLGSQARRLDSLQMMGRCAFELGRYQDTVNHLEQALAAPELPAEMRSGFHFDLGRAFQALGDIERARSAYESVRASDADFPGIDEKLAELESVGGHALSEADAASGFETFDDLIAAAEAEEESPAQELEAFESFDDVITDVESAAAQPLRPAAPTPPEASAPEPLVEAESPSGAAGEPDANADSASQSNPRSRRKKKISFV